jgi:dolichol-phosphate mannosyltransferase
LPGLRAWVGYRNTVVYYDRQDRLAGDGKLSFTSRIKYAMDAITSFSYKPLRLSFALFFLAGSVAALLAVMMLFSKSPVAVAGFGVGASVFFIGGLLLLCLGVLGEYIGRMYDEVRNRPLSIVSSVHRSPVKIAPHLAVIAAKGYAGQPDGETETAVVEAA